MSSKTKVYWVVPSVNADSAGFRVRTQPISKALEGFGYIATIVTLEEFPGKLDEIIKASAKVIIAKPTDASTYLCIRHLRDRGIHVVADVFDNYFSWSAALFKKQLHWQWLRMLSAVSGIVVSTDFLKATLEKVFNAPIYLAHDPLNAGIVFDWQVASTKWCETEIIECLWFGIHGNPYFPAGLDDVASWARVLGKMQEGLQGKAMRVTLCTNTVPNVESVLAYLRSNAIEARFVQWTEVSCRELLKRAHVVVIPTNLSGFSLSKTHNRCSDALRSGCLVMTSPDGPYREIGGAVYSSVNELVSVVNGSAEGVRAVLEKSHVRLDDSFPVMDAAEAFHQALSQCVSNRPPALKGRKILIVASSNIYTVKLSRGLGYVSASFKDSGAQINYDVIYEGWAAEEGRLKLSFTPNGLKYVLDSLQANPDADWRDMSGRRLCDLGDMSAAFDAKQLSCRLSVPRLEQLARQIEEMRMLAVANPALREQWIDINIALLFGIFAALGLENAELASDEAGGWKAYVDFVARDLGLTEGRLREYWANYRGIESEVLCEAPV